MRGQLRPRGSPISRGTEMNLAATISDSATAASRVRGNIQKQRLNTASKSPLTPPLFQEPTASRHPIGRAWLAHQPKTANTGICTSICAAMLDVKAC